jgi:hypothetical protein
LRHLRRNKVTLVQVIYAEASKGHEVENLAPFAQRFVQRFFMQAVVHRAAHDGLEHIAIVRLGQVVIGTGLESLDYVLVFGLGGLHHHRDMLHHIAILDIGE